MVTPPDTGVGQHLVARGLVRAEPVQRQRPIVPVDIGDRLLSPDSPRPGAPARRSPPASGPSPPSRRPRWSAGIYACAFQLGSSGLRRLHDPGAPCTASATRLSEPGKMAVGDDGGVVPVAGIGAEHPPHMLAAPFGEGLHRFFRHQRIVKRDAGLPGVEQFCVGDALGSLVDIGGRSTMAGDLPPSSSVTGVKIAAAASATMRPTARRAGEDQMIEGQCRERFRHLVLDSR